MNYVKNSPAGSKQDNETIVNTRSTKYNHLHLFLVIIIIVIVAVVVDDVVKSFLMSACKMPLQHKPSQ